MKFLTSISHLFCKKRRKPQSSHPSSLPKQVSKAQSSNSSDNDGKDVSNSSQPPQNDVNNRLKETTQTQLISENEEEVPQSDIKSSQQSANVDGEISTITSCSKEKEEKEIQKDAEEHEKAAEIQTEVEKFMQGEGLQPFIKRRKNNEDVQEEDDNEKSEEQIQGGDNIIEKKDEDEDEFSDEVSYQSSPRSPGIIADFDEISVVESEYVLIEDKQAMEELKKFPLEKLKITKEKHFDMRSKLTMKYLALCKGAGQDAKSYYYNEFYKSKEQEIVKDNAENVNENSLKQVEPEKEGSGLEAAAVEELKKLHLNELNLTKDKRFDQRNKQRKIHLDSCEKANKERDQCETESPK